MSFDGQRFCLKWNDFRNSVTAVFEDLRQDEELVDITLCCEGKKVKAHRMMLSACSPYFRELLKENPCQHPVFFLKDTTFADLRAVIEFVYNGEVNVTQGQLSSFLKTAEMLQVRGLTGDDDKDSSTVPAASPAPAPAPMQRVHHSPMPPQQRQFIQRRPPMSPQHTPMRLPPAPVKRPMPPTPPIQTPPKRLLPTPQLSQPPPANNYVPEVVTMPDSPPPPPPPPAPAAPAAAPAAAAADGGGDLPSDASPASKRRRYSGSSGGEGPATPAAQEPVPSPSPAASPAGTSSDAPMPSPAPPQPQPQPQPQQQQPTAQSVTSQSPMTSHPPPPEMGAPPPGHDYGGHQGGMVKVEKVDVDISEEDEGLAALGDVANYEGSYDSDQSLGAMPMGGDPSQGGGMYVPGPSDGGAGSVVDTSGWPGGSCSSACPYCSETFITRDNLVNHIRCRHPDRSRLTCEVCFRSYGSRAALHGHMALHRGRTACHLCGKLFSTLGVKNRHVKMVHGVDSW